MYYNLNFENNRVIAYCSICNKEINSWDIDYYNNYPNGFNHAVEDAWVMHSKQHEEFDHIVHCQNGCGAVIGVWDNEYVSRYPNGFDCAVEQEQHNHNRHCHKLWDEWRKENNALEGETPRALIRRFGREGRNPFEITIPPDREYVWAGYWDWYEEIFYLTSYVINICGLTIGFNPHKNRFFPKIYFNGLKIPKIYIGGTRKLYFEQYR